MERDYLKAWDIFD
jgi:hypothetical protein